MGIYVCHLSPKSLLDFKNHPPWYMLTLTLSEAIAAELPPAKPQSQKMQPKAHKRVAEYRDVHV